MSEVDQANDVNVIEEEEEKENCALFLGDLSIFCDEKDIESAFAQFGEIVDVRIQRSKETARALSYGFIEFADSASAAAALSSMNYYLLKGRPLRIRWAASRKNPIKSAMTPHDSAATVYVRFLSQSADAVVCEESLRELFSNYGPVFDCAIKKLSQDPKSNRTKGYAFVSFDSGVLIHGGVDAAGVDAAYRASVDLRNRVVGNVRYRCELGYRLHKQYVNSMAQQGYAQDTAAMGMPAAFPMIPVGAYVPQYDYSQQGAAMQHHQHHPQQQEYCAPYAVQASVPYTVPAPAYQPVQQVPMQHQQQHQQQTLPVAPVSYPMQQEAAYQYPLSSYSFSPTAMVSSIINSNRSPTNYELQLLQAATPRSTMPAQATAQPSGAQQMAYGNPYVQQHAGYASAGPQQQHQMPTHTVVTPQHHQQQQQHAQYAQMPNQASAPMYTTAPQMQTAYAAPTQQYMSPAQYAALQYYPSSNHSTPTNANHDGGLRARSVSSDATGMGYAVQPSVMVGMPVAMMPMPLTTGGQVQYGRGGYQTTPQQAYMQQQQQQQQYQQQHHYQQQGQHQQSQPQQLGQQTSPQDKAHTPRGSCSEYFAAVKGLDLKVTTKAPAATHDSAEHGMMSMPLSGSRDSTPKSIYKERKTTPGARKGMLDGRGNDVRQQQMHQQMQMTQQMMLQLQMHQQMQIHFKAPSRRGSNESIGTTSLFMGSPGYEEGLQSGSMDADDSNNVVVREPLET